MLDRETGRKKLGRPFAATCARTTSGIGVGRFDGDRASSRMRRIRGNSKVGWRFVEDPARTQPGVRPPDRAEPVPQRSTLRAPGSTRSTASITKCPISSARSRSGRSGGSRNAWSRAQSTNSFIGRFQAKAGPKSDRPSAPAQRSSCPTPIGPISPSSASSGGRRADPVVSCRGRARPPLRVRRLRRRENRRRRRCRSAHSRSRCSSRPCSPNRRR